METPDFRSSFLIRIKLARAVNEINGHLLSTFPDSFPGLSNLQRWHTEFDKVVLPLEKKTSPGEENVARVKRISVTTLPAITTADRNTMIEYLRTTGKRFLRLKKYKIRLKDCLLMWDNSRPHTATNTKEFLTRRDVEP
ncbi:Uncharacterized protein FKW44_013508, partial [Caligus rogercresseyi]